MELKKVKDFIEQLSQMNQEAEVAIVTGVYKDGLRVDLVTAIDFDDDKVLIAGHDTLLKISGNINNSVVNI